MAEKKSKKGLTRRSFMKRTAVAGAGLAAAGPASKLLGNKSLDSIFDWIRQRPQH